MNPYIMNAFMDEIGMIKSANWRQKLVRGAKGSYAKIQRTLDPKAPNLLEMRLPSGKMVYGKINYGNNVKSYALHDDLGLALKQSLKDGNFGSVHHTANRLRAQGLSFK